MSKCPTRLLGGFLGGLLGGLLGGFLGLCVGFLRHGKLFSGNSVG